MRKVILTAAVLAAGCSGRGEVIPQPSPAPDSPATTEAINTTLLAAAPTTTEVVTTTEAPTTVPETETTEPVRTELRKQTPTPTSATTIPAVDYSSLPYNGWAIPEYIVACETGGTFSWTAYNASSGASGPYQLMPEWFGGALAMNQSQAAQHAKAAQLWNGGRGKSNWAACL